MSLFEKLQAVLILLSMAVGLALGHIPGLGGPAGRLIVPFLLLMLTGVFLQVPLRGLAEALGNPRFTGWNLGLNFLWVPLFCWLLGRIFLAEQPDLRVGLLMLLVTPCTDWYLVFTQLTLCRNSPMSLAIAVVVFPDRPLIALALVIEPLIELPVVALISQLLKRSGHSQ